MLVTTSSVALKRETVELVVQLTWSVPVLISDQDLMKMKMKCAVLAVLCCLCCALSADARPARLRSRPLDNSETWNNVMVMAKHVSLNTSGTQCSCTLLCLTFVIGILMQKCCKAIIKSNMENFSTNEICFFFVVFFCTLHACINSFPPVLTQAQAQDRDHETRLIPVISSDKLKVRALK